MYIKMRLIFLLVLVFCVSLSCWDNKPSLEEQNAIKALKAIQNGAEENISLEAYWGLLNAAKVEMDILKGVSKKKGCVLGAIEKSYATCEIAGKAWKQKLDAKDDKRRQDMNLTMSFSLSFGALSIEKANNCFKR